MPNEGKLTKAEVLAALRDVDANAGYMTAPGAATEIHTRWKALKDAGLVHLRSNRWRVTSIGRRLLQGDHDHV